MSSQYPNSGIPLPVLFMGLLVGKYISFPLQCNEEATVFTQWLAHSSNLWEACLQVLSWLDWTWPLSPGNITELLTVVGCVCSIFPAQAGLYCASNEICTKQRSGTYLSHIVHECLKQWAVEFLQFVSLLSIQQVSNYSVQSGTGSLGQVLGPPIGQPMDNLCESC